MVFNSAKARNKSTKQTAIRHNTQREVPTPVYLGLKIHAATRKRGLIDKLYKLGLSISYDRVLRISSSVAPSIIQRFETEGVVCPPQLKIGLFTTGQVDNIDHNPSSVTSADSFHGTAHSLCQHSAVENEGVAREQIVLGEEATEKRIPALPLTYTNILPSVPMPKEVKAPVVNEPAKP